MSLGLAIAGGAAIVAAPVLVTVFGRDPHDPRDPHADTHDVSDYHPQPAPTNDAPRSLAHYEQLNRQDDILPPAPPGTNAGGSPLYRATYVAAMFRDFDAAAIARQVLQDLGDKALLEATR